MHIINMDLPPEFSVNYYLDLSTLSIDRPISFTPRLIISGMYLSIASLVTTRHHNTALLIRLR